MNRAENPISREQPPLVVIGGYLNKINDIYGFQGPEQITSKNVREILATGPDGKIVASAWHIMIRQRPEGGQIKGVVGLLDVDDCLIDTSQAKRDFFEKASELVPEDKREFFKNAANFINKAARVLPVVNEAQNEDIHPERHAPLLEMRGVSKVIYYLNSGFDALVPHDEIAARALIADEIGAVDNIVPMNGYQPTEFDIFLPHLAVDVTKKLKEGGSAKNYFKEEDESKVMVGYGGVCPEGVYESVWQIYQETIASPSIPESEKHHADLPEDDREIWATFGQLDGQSEKTTEIMSQREENGERRLDELLIVTSGRKQPIFDIFLNEFHEGTQIVYIDDSVSQLILMDKNKIKVGRAMRPNTKRSSVPTPEGIPEINMAIMTLLQARDTVLAGKL